MTGIIIQVACVHSTEQALFCTRYNYSAIQRQTVVTAYFTSERLLLFAFALKYCHEVLVSIKCRVSLKLTDWLRLDRDI